MNIMADAIATHINTIYFFLIVILFNTYQVFFVKNFVTVAKRLRIITPIFHMANAIIAYTGAIISAYTHDLSPTVILMIPTSIFIMILEIKRHKKQRTIKSTQKELQEDFFQFARKIYVIQIITLVSVFIISKVF
jgi:hypothetical protein